MNANLPIMGHFSAILEALKNSKVLVVAGETGSGKSTQLPQFCLQLGLSQGKWIGQTQPRRLAARAVAERISVELGSSLGCRVGFKVRFHDQVSDQTQIKVMTDGVLLNEIQSNPLLSTYQYIIIDEVHERSLNIDFLLGYLKNLLKKRDDLKVLITSATVAHQEVARFFDHAPVIEVSGRVYPISQRYFPLWEEETAEKPVVPLELQAGVVEAVSDLWRTTDGNILVFMPTERDIHEAIEALGKARLMGAEIMPLYGRLSLEKQRSVLSTGGARRIIVSTNVAETSLTVPNIRGVVDTGLVRMSRYDYRSKIQKMPIEPISKASANQRAGRCGRVAPGICIRLYSEADFNLRPDYTDPEILRTNLASVILQMLNLKWLEVEKFPWLDPPESRLIQDGFHLLEELGALEKGQRTLTAIGKKMAHLPIEPRWARILLSGEALGCLKEIIVIVSALSLQDPRERPLSDLQAADEAHRRYRHPNSDFMSYLCLWREFHTANVPFSLKKLRAFCQKNYLSFVRLREWQDIAKQLCEFMRYPAANLIVFEGVEVSKAEENERYFAIHQALSAGLLSHIARWEVGVVYQGTRQRKWSVFPGSVLFKKQTPWIMAAEIIETQKTYGRCVAKIEPQWLEFFSKHLVKQQYLEPHFEKNRQQVCVFEKVTLLGLDIIPRRKVAFSKIDPERSHEIFIREGIVGRQLSITFGFISHNENLCDEQDRWEDRARRLALCIDEEVLVDFYLKNLPKTVTDTVCLKRFEASLSASQKEALKLDSLVLGAEGLSVTPFTHPDFLKMGATVFGLNYRFDPGSDEDGVSLQIPWVLLPAVNEVVCEWLVPGLLLEKITVLLEQLPKEIRRGCSPIAVHAQACQAVLKNHSQEESLFLALAKVLGTRMGQSISPGVWAEAKLPEHLFMNFQLWSETGEFLAQSRDFSELKEAYEEAALLEIARLERPANWPDAAVLDWNFGDFPSQLDLTVGSKLLRVYPCLEDDLSQVKLQIFAEAQCASQMTHRGVLRLLALKWAGSLREFRHQWQKDRRFQECLGRFGDQKTLLDLLTLRLVFLCVGNTLVIRDRPSFELALAQKFKLPEQFKTLTQDLLELFAVHDKFLVALNTAQRALSPKFSGIKNVESQRELLFAPSIWTDLPERWFSRYPVYLKGLIHRLDKMRLEPLKDTQKEARCQELVALFHTFKAFNQDFEQERTLYWTLVEYRLSIFAQHLPTLVPVSEKKLKVMLSFEA